jgi:hypothetical protein
MRDMRSMENHHARQICGILVHAVETQDRGRGGGVVIPEAAASCAAGVARRVLNPMEREEVEGLVMAMRRQGGGMSPASSSMSEHSQSV